MNLANAVPLSAREAINNYEDIVKDYDNKYQLVFKFNSDYQTLRLAQIEVLNYDVEINIPEVVESFGYSYPVTTIGQWEYSEDSTNEVDFESQYDFCSVFDIDNDAGQFNQYIKKIFIPNSVTTILPRAFDVSTFVDTKNEVVFKSINVPNSVTVIGAYAFQYTKIISVTIPNSVTRIYNDTFNHCQSLESVVIGKNVLELGNNAFGDTPSLSKIYAESERVPNASDSAFPSDCAATVFVPNGLLADYEGNWGKFSQLKFEELDPGQTSTVNAVKSSDLHLNISGRTISAEASSPISIFDLSGRSVVKPSQSINDVLSPGIYIVYSAAETRMILIK